MMSMCPAYNAKMIDIKINFNQHNSHEATQKLNISRFNKV